MPQIRVIAGLEPGSVYPLEGRKIVIGRDPTSDIPLALDSPASRHHAALYAEGRGWRIQDLGSLNGTMVNQKRIPDTALAHGDRIRIGDAEFVFEDERPVAENDGTAEAAAEVSNAPENAWAAEQAGASAEDTPAALEEAASDEGAAAVEESPSLTEAARPVSEESRSARRPQPPPPPARPATERAAPEPVLESAELQVLVQQMRGKTELIMGEIGKAIIGQKEIVNDVLTAIIARGHVLLIGMPGLAKTMLVRTISEVLDLRFKRIQFTPDLMPSDITGTDILEVDEQSGKKEYRFIRGPIFAQMLLADEINLTPPKTQAALLEAMQEYRVTTGGHTLDLAPPFFVLATQNPLEQEGTYPLPEAQLDRFMFSVFVDYPTEEEEEIIAKVTTAPQTYTLNKVLCAEDIIELQKAVRDLPVSDHVLKYAVRLVRATRPGDKRAPEWIKKWIHCGAGPRGAQNLIVGAKARAVIAGRLLVTCDDIRRVASPVLRHRMFTNFTADSEGMDTDKIVAKLLEAVPEPSDRDY